MESRDRLIVVSNRLPVRLRRAGEGWRTERSPGGLATAMTPILKRTGGLWIGWPGETGPVFEAKKQEVTSRWAERDKCIAVDLPPELARLYYEGYSNQTLWPLFHNFPSRFEFDSDHWDAYVEANKRFCDVVLEHYKPGDLIWVHDYHLMLLPQFLREALPDARIGFFLHIPFPSSEVFRVLPRGDEILEGLLGASFLGFQTHGHVQHFRTSLLRNLGIGSQMDRVAVSGRSVRLEALPIGIAPEEFIRVLEENKSARNRLASFRKRFADRRVLLAVDRTDYTKGIPERLRAYRRLLKTSCHLLGRVVLIQVAVPSREAIPEYEELNRQVNELVGEINGELGTPDWVPVVYIRRSISRSELVALYAVADVAWVAPLRDGMNLVAKEYVACQKGGEGVLVLSEFAGAAAEMGEALHVNPYDEERTAATLERALAMSSDERRERMQALYRRVLRNNVFAWGERFVTKLRESSVEGEEGLPGEPPELPVAAIVSDFERAERRLLLLNYDGTLVPIANRPSEAVPPPDVIEVLAALADNPRNCVAVVSGRPRSDLERWLGGIQRLWLFAEHGAIGRAPGSPSWKQLQPNAASNWKEQVQPILEHLVDRTPGSFIEEKEFSLVWHYRMSDPELGEWLANEQVAVMEGMLAETELMPIRGNKSVEVRLVGANKGVVLSMLQSSFPDVDFLFAVGDDNSDEDLFDRLRDEQVWTVRVGGAVSSARFHLRDQAGVRTLLQRFCSASIKTASQGV